MNKTEAEDDVVLTALVSGSDGFIGRNLIPRLRKAGYDVHPTESLGFTLSGMYRRFDVIVHLAANIVNVDQRARLGMAAYEDIALDMRMCRYVERNPPTKAFVVMSSCAVDYPDDPYCIVKRTLEAFATTLARQDIPVAVLRPFSGYGPDQSVEYPFRAIVDRALRRNDPLLVWSDAVRDWLYIDDLCNAIMMAIDGAFPWGKPMEIGTGHGVSFVRLAQLIAREVGYSPEIEIAADKIGSAAVRIAQPNAAAYCGFTAQVPLHEGIKRSVAQLRGHITVSR